ncbi:MAG: DNA/RNA nuclease SfsA [Clostridia bacterium]|nr:DNA/RNA nuclease SfsA [Clostridia bacterium]
MKYKEVVKGVFRERPNRFIAKVEIDGNEETVHVKNTGRCKELLLENSVVYLSVSDNPLRKTKYDLIAVEKQTENGTVLINMDSQAPNDMVAEWLKKGALFSKNAIIKREVTFGKSRFDFYVEDSNNKAFIEVKGVTLENNGVALFPDAPTERGVKHIKELCSCVEKGYFAYIIFVIQMSGINLFKPNDATHKEFGDALRQAEKAGVSILAYDSVVTNESVCINKPIMIEL